MERKEYMKMSRIFLKFLFIVLILLINCILVTRCADLTMKSVVFEKEDCGDSIVQMEEEVLLELICISDGDKPVISDYREMPSLWGERNLSIYDVIVHDNSYEDYHGKFIAVVRFDKLLYGDADDYYCTIGDKEMCIHISIESNNSFFVEKNIVPQPKIILDVDNTADSFYFNCDPTSSNFWKVYLFNGVEFLSSYVTKPGIFKCQLKDKEERVVAEKSFELVEEKCPTSDPEISGHLLPHATQNRTLRMNCTMRVGLPSHTEVSWVVKGTNRITTRDYLIRHPEFTNCGTKIRELEFQQITNDSGEITCKTKDNILKEKTVSMQLKIHDDNFSECKLSLATSNDYRGILNENVEFVALIDSYPHTPEITWKGHNSNAMKDRKEKFVVETNETQTKLTIKNFSKSDDVSYIVEAKIPDRLVSKSFELEVWENPLIKNLENVMSYYMENTTAKIDCITSSQPNLRKTWSFKLDPDSLHTLSKKQIEDLGFTSTNKTVTWTIQTSGNLSCKACISLIKSGEECYTFERQIFMTDVPGGFGIIGPKRELMVGDRLELICAASIYHYTDQIEWKNSDGVPLNTTGRISINRIKTRLNYRSILIIDPLGESDNNDSYVCSSNRVDHRMGVNINIRTFLLSVRMQVLEIYRSNLNGTESIYRVGSSIHLWCYAKGEPEARVTWWKNNVQISESTPHNQTDACNYRLEDNDQRFHISSADRICEGFYSCRGINKFNMSVTKNQTISIESLDAKTSGEKTSIIVIVILIVVVITIFLSFMVCMRIRTKQAEEKLKKMCLENFAKGVPESLNAEESILQQAAILPYDAKYEFPIRKLEFGKILGAGNFGTVIKAHARGIRKGEAVTTVAVKTTEPKYIKNLASELKIMIFVGKHVNLVSLLGACTKNIVRGELLVITEHCCFGSLLNCLERHKANFINQIDSVTGKLDFSIGLDRPDRSVQSVENNKSEPQPASSEELRSNQDSICTIDIISSGGDNRDDNPLALNTNTPNQSTEDKKSEPQSASSEELRSNLDSVCTIDIISSGGDNRDEISPASNTNTPNQSIEDDKSEPQLASSEEHRSKQDSICTNNIISSGGDNRDENSSALNTNSSNQPTEDHTSDLQAASPGKLRFDKSSIYASHIVEQEEDDHDDSFPVLNTYVLLWWSWQVARGMDFLVGKKVLHRDLAARNILLAKGNVAKICDFGLSKPLLDKDYYRMSTGKVLPVQYMALESLVSDIFSAESDVWTFGVVLWELFTLGQTPHDHCYRKKILENLRKCSHLKKPVNANEEIYNIMKQCWNVEPKLRPTFRDLMKQISVLLGQDERTLLKKLGTFK